MEDTKIEIVDFCLQDIGNATYTEYELNCDTAGYYADHMDTLAGTKIGLLHSHNQMKAYLSGTDMSTLREQAEQCNNVLSIVVNNAGEYVAKFTERKRVIKSDNITVDTTEDIMWNYMGEKPCTEKNVYTTHSNNQEDYYKILCWDCDIERPLDVPIDEEFKKECIEKEGLLKQKKEDNIREFVPNFRHEKAGYHYNHLWNNLFYLKDRDEISTMVDSILSLSFFPCCLDNLNDDLSEDFLYFFLYAWVEYYNPTDEQLSKVIEKFKSMTEGCDYPKTRDYIIELLTNELITIKI